MQPLLVSDYFKGPDTLTLPKVLEKIYKYRSSIAHGEKADFEKELKILKGNENNILEFIHIITKKSLIQALVNPIMIDDLKRR